MLPEILSVSKEDGGVAWVPLTPITTFRDVAACVRDTGDPLPLLVETSPLGVRVVAGWERPLELLRLWNGLKDQVSYTASYNHRDDPNDLLSSFSRSYRLGDEEEELDERDQISPWELYDLKDELKDIGADLRRPLNGTSSRSGFPGAPPSFKRPPLSRSLDDSDDLAVVSSDGEADSSYNSHTHSPRNLFVRSIIGKNGFNRQNSRSLRHPANRRGSDALKRVAKSPFLRGKVFTSSLPSKSQRIFHSPVYSLKEFHSSQFPMSVHHAETGHRKHAFRESVTENGSHPFLGNFSDFDRRWDYLPSHGDYVNGMNWTRNLSPVISKKQKLKPAEYKHLSTKSETRRRSPPPPPPPPPVPPHYGLLSSEFHNGTKGLEISPTRQTQSHQNNCTHLLQEFVNNRLARDLQAREPNHKNVHRGTINFSELPAKSAHHTHRRRDTHVADEVRNGHAKTHTSPHIQHGVRNEVCFQHRSEEKSRRQQFLSHNEPRSRSSSARTPSDPAGRSQRRPSQQPARAAWQGAAKELRLLHGEASKPSRGRDGEATDKAEEQRVRGSRRSEPGPRTASERPSRRSGAQRSVHRRSYSDPLYEYLREDLGALDFRRPPVRRRRHSGGGALAGDVGMRDTHGPLTLLPDGCELTVGELRDMANRQQQQIESQQQLLVAREQRLKYLKQQESRAAAVAAEAERLRRLRERVEAQEAKLRRLRALRGQVEATRHNTASLTTDLDAMRHLFSEKEKELVVAVSKVEELTRQLEELRHGRSPLSPNNQHHSELDKLRRELLYRNSVNREASARVAAQRETLAARRDEITRIDKRISELQQRLHRKRILNHQLASQITAATQAKQAQLKAVQQKAMRDGIHSENSADDTHAPDHLKLPPGEDLGEFGPNKNDPKYQTLPYNTKFSVTFKTKSAQGGDSDSAPSTPTSTVPPGGLPDFPASSAQNNGTTAAAANANGAPVNGSVVTRTVHSIPTHPPSRGHAHAPVPSQGPPLAQTAAAAALKPAPNPAMTPRVYGPGAQQFNQRSQPLGGSTLGQNQKLSPGVTAHAQSRTLLLPHHHAQDVDNMRAVGNAGEGSEDLPTATEGGRNKPALPPKPVVPSKPLPPPRQKGDPLVASNESLNAAQTAGRGGGTTQGRLQQGYRYASQNVIMSTYTQQPPGPDSQPGEGADDNNRSKVANNVLNNNNNNSSSSGGAKSESDGGEKVHVSINSRIEMPPDFMFPEDETPPSDLLGRRVEEIENGGDGHHKDTRGSDAVDNLHVSSSSGLPVGELEKLRIDNAKEDRSSQENIHSANNNAPGGNIPSDDSRQPDGADTSSVPIEGHTEGDGEKSMGSTSLNNINNNNNNNNNNTTTSIVRRIKKGNLKTKNSSRVPRRVSFDPLALLLDAALEGELELVKRTAMEVPNPSAANDEGITALHNAICAGHLDIVTFLVTFGCDVNAQDSDGWTPLHCAASCNNVAMVRFLVEHGACILATTLSDHETAAEKCEQDEEGYDGCSQYLYSVQEKLGIMNGGVVFGVYDYEGQAGDELTFRCGDALTILRRGDEYEREWWWGQLRDIQGYVPRNLLGLYPRVKSPVRDS